MIVWDNWLQVEQSDRVTLCSMVSRSFSLHVESVLGFMMRS